MLRSRLLVGTLEKLLQADHRHDCRDLRAASAKTSCRAPLSSGRLTLNLVDPDGSQWLCGASDSRSADGGIALIAGVLVVSVL
jgi:hypothetical protein